MKILVTGGAGFIGSHLVDSLLEEGHQVKVLDNLFRGKRENLAKHVKKKNFEFVEQDIRNFEDVQNSMKNCDIVFHLAAQSNVMGAISDMDYSFQTNVIGTFNVLKAAAQNKVKRLIFTSSREAYGEAQYIPVDEKHPLSSKNTYGASKVAGEKYCQVFQNMDQLEVVIFRLANVYGLRDFNRVIPIFLDNIKNKENIKIYGGKQVIDFVHVSIVVKALIAAIDNEGCLTAPTNVGSGQGTTLFELASRIKELSKSETEVIVEPPRSVEVVKFTAAIDRFKQIFDVSIPVDPLFSLPEMIQKTLR